MLHKLIPVKNSINKEKTKSLSYGLEIINQYHNVLSKEKNADRIT